MNILFVCRRNKWRSKTAETIYRNHGFHQFKSAGTSNSANIKINQSHLNWADLVFVMEQKHKDQINAKFDITTDTIVILDIEDNYEYMNKDLIQMLKESIDPYL